MVLDVDDPVYKEIFFKTIQIKDRSIDYPIEQENVLSELSL